MLSQAFLPRKAADSSIMSCTALCIFPDAMQKIVDGLLRLILSCGNERVICLFGYNTN